MVDADGRARPVPASRFKLKSQAFEFELREWCQLEDFGSKQRFWGEGQLTE
jgi:hypothetical protein